MVDHWSPMVWGDLTLYWLGWKGLRLSFDREKVLTTNRPEALDQQTRLEGSSWSPIDWETLTAYWISILTTYWRTAASHLLPGYSVYLYGPDYQIKLKPWPHIEQWGSLLLLRRISWPPIIGRKAISSYQVVGANHLQILALGGGEEGSDHLLFGCLLEELRTHIRMVMITPPPQYCVMTRPHATPDPATRYTHH